MRLALIAGGIMLGCGLILAGGRPRRRGSAEELAGIALSFLGVSLLAIEGAIP